MKADLEVANTAEIPTLKALGEIENLLINWLM